MEPHLLLDLLRQRSNRAYRWLYKQYFVALKNLAIHYVKDAEIAGDLVQDTFFALLESKAKFNDVDQVKYYLYRSLKNKCISHLRKIQVREKAEESLIEHLSLQGYWEQVLEEDIFSQLMVAIHTLPPQCKIVMQLSLQGMTTKEIAEKMNISPETVKDHKTNGRKKLAKWFKSREIRILLSFLLS